MSTAAVGFSPRGTAARRAVPAAHRPLGATVGTREHGCVAPSESRACDVRLTRRGRLALVTLVLLTVFAAFTVLSGPAVSSGEANHATSQSVVVGPGETLWDIAQRLAPGEDPRDVIAEIVDLNALSDAGEIRVGQKLFVPVA